MGEAPLVRIIVMIVFALIVISLGSAFFSLFRKRGPDAVSAEDDTTAVKALTVRVGLSVALVLALIILNALGIIEPNG